MIDVSWLNGRRHPSTGPGSGIVFHASKAWHRVAFCNGLSQSNVCAKLSDIRFTGIPEDADPERPLQIGSNRVGRTIAGSDDLAIPGDSRPEPAGDRSLEATAIKP